MSGPTVVRFGMQVPISTKFYQQDGGRIFVNLLDGEAIEPGDFAKIEGSGTFGVDVRKCVVFEAGFKKVDTIERLGELVGAAPYFVRGHCSWVNEPLEDLLKSSITVRGVTYPYGRYIEVDDSVVLVVSETPITTDHPIEAKAAKGQVLMVGIADLEPGEDHDVDTYADFIQDILAVTPQRILGTLIPRRLPRTTVMVEFEVTHVNGRQQHSLRETCDGSDEGTIAVLWATSDNGPISKGSVVEVTYEGRNNFLLRKSTAKPRALVGSIEDFLDVLEIDRKSLKTEKPELRTTDSIRVTRS
jgi:hypothetical protein